MRAGDLLGPCVYCSSQTFGKRDKHIGNSCLPPTSPSHSPEREYRTESDPSGQDAQLARLKRLQSPRNAQVGANPPESQPPRRGVGGTRALAHSIYIYIYGGFLKWGYPKSSILTGFSIINHPLGGTPIYSVVIKHVTSCSFYSIQ